MEFIFKVIGNMETDSKQTKIQNEVIYKANHISINVLKNALYSVETRQELIQSGIDAAKEFIENKNILQNCV